MRATRTEAVAPVVVAASDQPEAAAAAVARSRHHTGLADVNLRTTELFCGIDRATAPTIGGGGGGGTTTVMTTLS